MKTRKGNEMKTRKGEQMKTTNKSKWIVTGLTLALLSGIAHADVITVTDDAYISIGSPTTTFGTTDPNQLVTSDADAKVYIKFDASSYGLTQLTDVASLTVYSKSSGRSRTLTFFLLEGTGVDDWDETTLTSNNAPLNDATGDGFVAGAGETLTALGFGLNSGDDLVQLDIVFGATEETALLNALNTGDRVATIGVQLSSNSYTYLSSSERDGGIYAPSLNVTAIPEPATFGLLGVAVFGLLALRRFRV
jgi:hypothetical protein